MKWIKRLLILALVALVVMQFIQPEKNTEPNYESVQAFVAETKPNAEVTTILKETCYDCHSNNTVYPWYGNIAPLSYWLADHIEEGKEHLNFSAWNSYSAKRKDHKLEELIEEVEEGEMPLESYTWIHESARLSQEQIKAMTDWAATARLQYTLPEAE